MRSERSDSKEEVKSDSTSNSAVKAVSSDEAIQAEKKDEIKEEKEKKPEAKEEKPEFCKKTLLELSTNISNIKEMPDSYSLAVRIELIFSLHLLQLLLLDAQDDLQEKARQVLTFLKLRWEELRNTSAWDVNSRLSRINQSCWNTTKYFLAFFPENLTLQKIKKFEEECKAEADAILAGEEDDDDTPATGESAIYKFIYKNIFAKQPIRDAWSLLPKEMQEAGSVKDTWRILLQKIIPEVPNRETFIRIITRQVDREDWPYFFSRLTSHAHLFSLMLEVDLNAIHGAHKDKAKDQQTDKNFDIAAFEAADKELRAKSVTYFAGFIPAYGVEGSEFKRRLIDRHPCETQLEVLALAYAMVETYRRVRKWRGSHTSVLGKAVSAVASVADKDVKVAGCDILMAFCLQADQFSLNELENYIAAKKREGTLSTEEEKEFRNAIGDGVLKLLFEALCDISVKVQALPAYKR